MKPLRNSSRLSVEDETIGCSTQIVDSEFDLVPFHSALRQSGARIAGATEVGVSPSHSYDSPLSVHWEFTNRCNLCCEFCYNSSTSRVTVCLPEQRLLEIADELTELGVFEVTLSGGEVFTEQKTLWKLVDRLHKGRISLRLISNGWYLNEGTVEKLSATGFTHITVSLDASDPETHDELRRVSGSWRRAVHGLSVLSRSQLYRTVTCVLNRRNAASTERLVRLCDLLAVQRVVFEDFRNSGRGAESSKNFRLSDEEYEDVYLSLRELAKSRSSGCRIVFGNDTRFALELLAITPPFTCCIRSNGDVVPVEALPVPFGNVGGERLQAAWKRLSEAYAGGEFRSLAATWSNIETPRLRLARSVKISTRASQRSPVPAGM